MVRINLENITLTLSVEFHRNPSKLLSILRWVRVTTEGHSVILEDQTIENVSRILIRNFDVVKSFYDSRLRSNLTITVDNVDLSTISISIVLRHLHTYNMWRRMYRTFKNHDLHFLEEHFDAWEAKDTILYYFRSKYPTEWEAKCCILMDLSLAQLYEYQKMRQALT